MTLQQFLEKYNGKYVEVAGSAGAENQCVDLANAYIRDVLGFPIIEWTNAKDFPSKGGENYQYILNTPEGIPQEGDLMIWGGTYGHIAVFIEGNETSFRSFDQNYPTGSFCHIQNHTYANVLGWMRPIKKTDLQQAFDECRIARDSHWNDLIAIADLLHVEVSRTVILAEITKLITYEDAVVQKDKQLTEAQQQISLLQKKTIEQDASLAKLSEETKALSEKVQLATSENQELSRALHDLESQCATPAFQGWKKFIYNILLKAR